ncbi:MAG TPA: NUDIX domain-containing protein [Micromonosporaceae bacterium]
MTRIDAPVGSAENPVPRRAARVLLIDAADRVLLFHGFDPHRPDVRYWFTVGGGLDPDERPAEGAVRELREETGLSVTVEQLGEAVWHETTQFPFEGVWYQQEQDYFAVRVPTWQVTVDGFGEVERRSIDGHRWWTVPELLSTSDRVYPPNLPSLLRGILGT